jgi:hypothetical protein
MIYVLIKNLFVELMNSRGVLLVLESCFVNEREFIPRVSVLLSIWVFIV